MITSPVAQYNKTIKYEAKNREAVKSKDIDFDTITRDARNWQNFYGLVPESPKQGNEPSECLDIGKLLFCLK